MTHPYERDREHLTGELYVDMSADELECSNYGRECNGLVRLGVWAAVLGICGAVLGFFIAWLYPAVHGLFSKL